MKKFDFAKFRTHELLASTMVLYCDAVYSASSLRGNCLVHRCWETTEKKTLHCGGDSPVAYCHKCHRYFDALALTALATGKNLYESAEVLQKDFAAA